MHPPILILGVPRSGTSLTAQLVHAWGAYSGEMRELHKADEWNKAGYYEHLSVCALIKRMLDGHLVPTDSRFEVFEEPARELVRSMMKACPSDRPWFWKVPEMTPLFPFWKQRVEEVTGTSPICIVVLRNPANSAHSQKRYFEQKALKAEAPDFPFGHALMVWQYYMAFLLNNTDPDRTIYVSMEDLLSHEQAVMRLENFLDQTYGCNGTAVMASIPQEALVNQRDNDLTLLTPKQRELYTILQRQTQSPTLPDGIWPSLMPTADECGEIQAIEQWVAGKVAAKVG
ncbi:MAG TPA: sulfotransferase [Polyangium sp.]|nr:sulfotransferase [Polyangium sp.]